MKDWCSTQKQDRKRYPTTLFKKIFFEHRIFASFCNSRLILWKWNWLSLCFKGLMPLIILGKVLNLKEIFKRYNCRSEKLCFWNRVSGFLVKDNRDQNFPFWVRDWNGDSEILKGSSGFVNFQLRNLNPPNMNFFTSRIFLPEFRFF